MVLNAPTSSRPSLSTVGLRQESRRGVAKAIFQQFIRLVMTKTAPEGQRSFPEMHVDRRVNRGDGPGKRIRFRGWLSPKTRPKRLKGRSARSRGPHVPVPTNSFGKALFCGLAFGSSLLGLLPSSVNARITVRFTTDSITVNQRVGAIRIPVEILGNPTNSHSRMVWRTQEVTARYGRDYNYSRGLWGYNTIYFDTGNSRTRHLVLAIPFTGSAGDRTFTVLLDPEEPIWSIDLTYDADAGDPAFVTVKILGVSPRYQALRRAHRQTSLRLNRAKRQFASARRGGNAPRIARLRKQMRLLTRQQRVTRMRMDRAV